MASLAQMIRELIEEAYKREDEEGRFHGQLAAFRDTLIPDLSVEQFADMYAQTITYGLFAARVQAPSGREFTRQQAAWNLPKTNPFLRRLFNEIAGPDLSKEISWAVDDLAHLLARADMSEVLKDFGKATKQEDPVVHFYETFLAHYNPRMRQRRGVYYTPEPVVSYIVRSIDHLLKTRFDRPLGLADENVMILDPACGTGTFLYFVIQEIHDTVVRERGAGAWNSYVREKLLGRIFGFELLMAPYAMAHMKLALQLQELGYDFEGDERLGIYLTNSLEEAITKAETLGFARFISEEANAAGEVKRQKPIMVVLGNPPYHGHSSNRSTAPVDVRKGSSYVRGWEIGPDGRARVVQSQAKRDMPGKLQPTFIGTLIRDYYVCDGHWLEERNPKWLQDDYVKFMRWAQWRIERTGYGVLAFITNHGYIDDLTKRGMRQSLMGAFEQIYVLDLHGSSKKGQTPPDGSQDENVFDIPLGVAIGAFVRGGRCEDDPFVCHSELWGPRTRKGAWLAANSIQSTDWTRVTPQTPWHLFAPEDLELRTEYDKGWELTDAFPVHTPGVVTGRDRFALAFDLRDLETRVSDFLDPARSDAELRENYLSPSDKLSIDEVRRVMGTAYSTEEAFVKCLFRPFDMRWLFYDDNVLARSRRTVMRNMLASRNLALITTRQTRDEWGSLATRCVCGHKSCAAYDINTCFPLYLTTWADDPGRPAPTVDAPQREPNLSPGFVRAMVDRLVLDFVPDGKGDLESTFGPEDIFHYMYAVFHSATYRERYAEFLKIDFPQLPLTSDLVLFRALAEKGEELVALHLMESPALDHRITKFPITGSNEVEKVRYVEETSEGGLAPGRVYVNKTQYFQGVEPEVWEFHIGGYQVLHKWLKDRKGRTLSYDDVTHYGKIVVALKETIRLMGEIDEVIPSWPME